MEIEAGPVPQPENVNVGFNETTPDEAAIEQQILDAEKSGTSIGELEDAKKGKAAKPDKPAEDSKKAEEKTDNSETPAEKEKREAQARDEQGKFKKAEKSESDYDKAKKDRERLSKSWNDFEAECKQSGIDLEALNTGKKSWQDLERCKGFIRKQIETAVAGERARLEADRQRMQQQAANRGDFSPQEYHQAAIDFQQAAWKALSSDDPEQVAKAKELFANANACMSAAQKTWEWQLVQHRDKDITETLSKYPELKDVNGEAGKAMMRMLQENPFLARLPNGFSKAAQFLAAMKESARVSELEAQVKQITKEKDDAVKQLKAATALAGAGSQAQPLPEKFDDLPASEQERAVDRMFTTSGEFVHSRS